MAKKKTTKKQPELPKIEGPGVAPVEIPAIDEALEQYLDVHERVQVVKEEEKPLVERLTMLMHQHADQLRNGNGELVYRSGDTICRLSLSKIKVQSAIEAEELD